MDSLRHLLSLEIVEPTEKSQEIVEIMQRPQGISNLRYYLLCI